MLRLPAVLKHTAGFVYYVSIAGITGTKSAAVASVAAAVARLKRHCTLPVAVGFGIRTPAQAAEVARVADAAVVGSALVECVASGVGPGGAAGPGLVAAVLGRVQRIERRRAPGAARVMNWLTNLVLPKIRAAVAKRDVPENLWHKCPGCGQMLFHRELEASLHVCSNCGHHLRLPPLARLALLFDDGHGTPVELPRTVIDPLRFRDRKRYGERLKEAQAKSSRTDAVIVAHGTIGGIAAVAVAFDFEFLGGSMGIAVGEAFIAAARLAVLQEAALVVVPASGGARMQEGILALMQMPRTTLAVEMVREKRLAYIVILTDPTTGGVSASFAMLGDVTIAEPGAVVGFAGARVIEETIREKLPEGFQRSEYLLEHGMVDMVVKRGELKATLARVLDLLTRRGRPETEHAAPAVELGF